VLGLEHQHVVEGARDAQGHCVRERTLTEGVNQEDSGGCSDKGMLGYVAGVQRKEIREGIACVKHQNMSGSDMGDDHKEYFAGEAALKAAGKDNTMNQF
jgi:isocitrate lyase